MKKELSFRKTVTGYDFNNRILKEYMILQRSEKLFELCLDFRYIEFIALEVSVQLLALGEQALKSGNVISIILIYEEEITNYLYHNGFIESAYKNDLIKFYQIDGYAKPSREKTPQDATNLVTYFKKEKLIDHYINSPTYFFEKNLSEKDLLYRCLELEVLNSLASYRNSSYGSPTIILKEMFENNNYKEYLKVLSNVAWYEIKKPDNRKIKCLEQNRAFMYGTFLIEMIHNALFHGNTCCVAGVQSYYDKDKRLPVVEICVCDTGVGCYDTLVNRVEKTYSIDTECFLEFGKLKDIISKIEKNYFSIYETIFYRKEVGLRGVFDVYEDISNIGKKGSKIEFKNNNVYLDCSIDYIKKLVETNNEYDEIEENIRDLIDEIKSDNRTRKLENKYRIADYNNDFLPGVNIYIKIYV